MTVNSCLHRVRSLPSIQSRSVDHFWGRGSSFQCSSWDSHYRYFALLSATRSILRTIMTVFLANRVCIRRQSRCPIPCLTGVCDLRCPHLIRHRHHDGHGSLVRPLHPPTLALRSPGVSGFLTMREPWQNIQTMVTESKNAGQSILPAKDSTKTSE